MKYKVKWNDRKDWYSPENKSGEFKVTLEAGEYFFKLGADIEKKDISPALYEFAVEKYKKYMESSSLEDIEDYEILMKAIKIVMSSEIGEVLLTEVK